jgi:phosphatidylglycerol:prolipoprotein diacylglycerol transferase
MGLFLAGYGLGRFIVEYFRQADPQFITPDNPLGHVLSLTPTLGLSMGQLLSLPMLVIGVAIVVIARRRAG